MCSLRCVVLFALMGVVLTALSGNTADPPKRKGLAKASDIADFVQQELKAKGETQVALGAFTPRSDTLANGGPGLKQKLHAELERRGLQVRLGNVNFTVKGEFSRSEVKPDADAKPLSALKVKLTIADSKTEDDIVGEFLILDEQVQLEAFGKSVELPPTPNQPIPNPTRDKVLRQAIDRAPAPLIKGGAVFSSDKKTFGMEVLVDSKERAQEVKDGAAFVKLVRGEKYEVRLSNNDQNLDMVADLTIDGISVFEFSEIRDDKDKSRPKFSSYLIPKGEKLVIRGWHINMQRADKFEVAAYADSEAAKLAKAADSAEVGQITAVFRVAWPAGEKPPQGEVKSYDVDGNATKRGPPTEFNTKEVAVDIGSVRGSVSVRYSKTAK